MTPAPLIHFVASGPSVLTNWHDGIPKPGEIACAVSGAARYVRDRVLDWWVVADRHDTYSRLLDPPVTPQPKLGHLVDAASASYFAKSRNRVEVTEDCWPLPETKRRFSAPSAAIWLLTHYDGPMQCYGVDLAGASYAWGIGPAVDTPVALVERWEIEREAWRVIATRFPQRVRGLPAWLFDRRVHARVEA